MKISKISIKKKQKGCEINQITNSCYHRELFVVALSRVLHFTSSLSLFSFTHSICCGFFYSPSFADFFSFFVLFFIVWKVAQFLMNKYVDRNLCSFSAHEQLTLVLFIDNWWLLNHEMTIFSIESSLLHFQAIPIQHTNAHTHTHNHGLPLLRHQPKQPCDMLR